MESTEKFLLRILEQTKPLKEVLLEAQQAKNDQINAQADVYPLLLDFWRKADYRWPAMIHGEPTRVASEPTEAPGASK